MLTNIVIDDKLVTETIGLTGAKTKREVVNLALKNLVARYCQQVILNLAVPAYAVQAIR